MSNVVNQVIYDLVQGDTGPALNVRFPNFDLGDYTSITMEIRRAITGDIISKTVTPDGTDDELGSVTWSSGDLEVGDNKAAFEFTVGGKTFRLPRKFPVILRVRKKI